MPSGTTAEALAGEDTAGLTERERDWRAIKKLEQEAKAIAKITGCGRNEQCRSAPVGSRACGGPRYYLSYCVVSTDTGALFRKLDEVAKAEQAFNQKYHVYSTCEVQVAPEVGAVGGRCVEK
jgi:hypothetical protein